MGVMEGDSAIQAVYGARADDAEVADQVERMRKDYDHQLDATFAAARGFVDLIVTPEEVRDLLAFALRVTSHYAGPHLGPFVLPPRDYAIG
jgi:acetyl-CoA carboxylase carboxyltransferase component